MPFAVTHILIPMILVDLVRDHLFKEKRRLLHNNYVFLAGIGGILPDIDIFIGWILFFLTGAGVTDIHRLYTHTFVFPLILIALGVFAYKRIEKRHYWKILTMLGIGIFLHVLLDMVVLGDRGPVYPLYPFSDNPFFGWSIFPQTVEGATILASIDAILLILWLIHEERTHKISDFL